MGISSNATTKDKIRVVMIDTPMCSPISFNKKSSEKRKGRNTVMVVPAGDQVDVTSHAARLGEGKQLIRPRASQLLAGGLAFANQKPYRFDTPVWCAGLP